MAISLAWKTLLGAGVSALALPPSASDAPGSPADMPVAIEDFTHPRAAELEQERGVILKRGEGHVWLTDVTDLNECRSSASNIAIESRKGIYCFRTDTKSGFLTLELPDTFSIWTQDRPVKATLTAEGKSTVVNAPADKLTPVGETGDTGLRSVLVEIRVTG
ncbi:hypothetical protein ACFXOK_10430 [Streptomyces sp. NPDC059173]|uniref:hypothetical protein n=1 Tax=unclassified Streptomyces TaxID=2593676 RepID=UPI00345219D4